MSDILFDRIAIIGLGLEGSSLARVIKREGMAGHIAGCARTEATRNTAMKLGFVDSIHTDPADAAADANLVMLCTSVGIFGELAARMAPALKSGAIVTDVGSVKQAVIRDVGPLLPDGVHFVPGHPIAGTEKSGPEAGFAELFEHRYVILTPPPGTDSRAVDKVAELWRRAGSMVDIMEAGHHDRVLAITSHLPHLISYTIVGTVADLESQLRRDSSNIGDVIETQEVIKYSASGFRDFTRLAGSDPVMWRDVFLNNRESVLEMLGRFVEDLTALQRAIRWGEGDALQDLFTRTREIRRGVVEMGQAGQFIATESDSGKDADSDKDRNS